MIAPAPTQTPSIAAITGCGQPERSLRDLLRLDQAALRIETSQCLPRRGSIPAGPCPDRVDRAFNQIGISEAGAQGVDRNRRCRKFERQTAHQSQHAMLGGSIGAGIGIATQGRRAGHGNDPPVRGGAQIGHCRLRAVEHRIEVGCDHAMPDGRIDCLESRCLGSAGIGDKDRNRAVGRPRGGEGPVHLRPIGQVGNGRSRARRRRDSVKLFRAPPDDGHARARRRQCTGNCRTDSGAAARHHRMCPRQRHQARSIMAGSAALAMLRASCAMPASYGGGTATPRYCAVAAARSVHIGSMR